jgi:hypothetical protein
MALLIWPEPDALFDFGGSCDKRKKRVKHDLPTSGNKSPTKRCFSPSLTCTLLATTPIPAWHLSLITILFAFCFIQNLYALLLPVELYIFYVCLFSLSHIALRVSVLCLRAPAMYSV